MFAFGRSPWERAGMCIPNWLLDTGPSAAAMGAATIVEPISAAMAKVAVSARRMGKAFLSGISRALGAFRQISPPST
jgi:hypothetical protein